MKVKDLFKKKASKPNPVAKFSRSAGAGAHKSPKDYNRNKKHKKDLRRVDEDEMNKYNAFADIKFYLHLTRDDFNKETIVRKLLSYYKDIADLQCASRTMHKIIGAFRNLGIDYPEFKTIEKSIGKK